MGFFSLGNRVKNKRFDYIPQHYDEGVENLKERMAKYGNPEISDAELAKARIRTGFKIKARGNKEALREGNKKANIRLAIILIFLTVGALTFIRSDAFAEFINRLFT